MLLNSLRVWCGFCVKVLYTLTFHSIPVLCRRTILTILLSQVLSILLCATAVFNQILKSEFSFSSSVCQSYLAYLLLGIVFAPILAYRRGFLGILAANWWKYVLIALIGVEGNYVMVSAQGYTSLTSMQVCLCVRAYVRACVCTRTCIRVGAYVHECLCVCVCACEYMHAYVCMYVRMHMHVCMYV